MDRARQKTDKRLKAMERSISRVYEKHPALLEVLREYADYMDMVDKRTHVAFMAFQRETDADHRAELKKVYTDKLEGLTTRSDKYHKLVNRIVSVLAKVNQEALDIVNSEMVGIYTENYNQVATECRKVGIKVNGKDER